jgi:hypothetical protein
LLELLEKNLSPSIGIARLVEYKPRMAGVDFTPNYRKIETSTGEGRGHDGETQNSARYLSI